MHHQGSFVTRQIEKQSRISWKMRNYGGRQERQEEQEEEKYRVDL